MNDLIFDLDELTGVAMEQIATLKAVDAALRESHEKIDTLAFAWPINALDDTIRRIGKIVQAQLLTLHEEVMA